MQDDAVNYLYNIDFADNAALLNEQAEGCPPSDELVTLLRSATGHLWERHGQHPYSLGGSTVIYNGENSSRLRSCDWFDRVVIVALGDDCTALHGNLVFHLHRKGLAV